MEPKEIIGKCWDYEFDYYDEYEKKISYISYSDEIAIDLSLETDNISIYRFFPFYADSYDDDGENAYSHLMQEAYGMDCNALLAMCQSYAKIKRGLFIFISDRDVDVNVKQMSDNGTYKKWGNGVYSFVLPVPEIRKRELVNTIIIRWKSSMAYSITKGRTEYLKNLELSVRTADRRFSETVHLQDLITKRLPQML